MKAFVHQIRQAPYLTYFKGPQDIIFYSCGAGCHPDTKSLKAVAVYYPSKHGNRIQPLSGQKYSRLIINGFQEDKKRLSRLTSLLRKTLLALFARDPVTAEPLLRVPLSQVKEVYNSRQSLKNFLTNPPRLLGIEKITSDIRYCLTFLEQNKIPRVDLGFYGSLQCGIYPQNIARDFNDIDFLVSGLKYQDTIVSLAKTHRHPLRFRRIDSTKALGIKVEKQQLNLTVVILKRNHHLVNLHLTQIRKSGDPFSFPDLTTIKFGRSAEISGQVTDSSEGLTCPSVYQVKTVKRPITILNRYYRFVKAAYKGDQVRARGKISQDSQYLLLADPEKDFLSTN